MWLVGPGEPLLRDGWPPLPKQGLEWLYRMPTMHPSLDWTQGRGGFPRGAGSGSLCFGEISGLRDS